MTDPSDTFYAQDRASWTRWLEANHASAQVVRLVFYRKGTGTACPSYEEAVQEALCFGWIDGLKQKLDDQRYTYRFTPRRPGSRWSESNRRRVAELEATGRLRAAGVAVITAARAAGAWDEPGGAAVPETPPAELTAALVASPTARMAWDALAPGHQHQWLMWVADAKRAETRGRRADAMVTRLDAGAKTP